MLIDDFARINRTARNALFAIVIFIVTMMIYDSVVGPHVGYLNAARRYKVVLGNVIERKRIITKVVEEKKQLLKQLSEESVDVRNKMFLPNEAKEFFSDLEAFAQQTDCTVYSLNFGTANKDDSKEESYIATKSAMLGVIGEYGNIIKLVEKLQSRPQTVYIDSLTLEPVEDVSGQVKSDITVRIYVIQDEEVTVHEQDKK